MFFRGQEEQIGLNLNAESIGAADAVPATLVMNQETPSVEDRVNQFYEQLREPIFRYLLSSFGGEHAHAEEITQDVFVQMYRCLKSGQAIQNIRAWAFRVAHNIALTQIKRQQFMAPLSDDEWHNIARSREDGQFTVSVGDGGTTGVTWPARGRLGRRSASPSRISSRAGR